MHLHAARAALHECCDRQILVATHGDIARPHRDATCRLRDARDLGHRAEPQAAHAVTPQPRSARDEPCDQCNGHDGDAGRHAPAVPRQGLGGGRAIGDGARIFREQIDERCRGTGLFAAPFLQIGVDAARLVGQAALEGCRAFIALQTPER